VAIRCADASTARCEVDGLASGETRAVRLELGAQLFVSGRVVHPDGSSVARAALLLLTPAERDDSDASPILDPNMRMDDVSLWRKEIASVESDTTGAFRMDATGPGPFLVRARSDGSQAFSPQFTLQSSRTDLELTLPIPGSVRGRVHAPGDASFEGLALWIAPIALWN